MFPDSLLRLQYQARLASLPMPGCCPSEMTSVKSATWTVGSRGTASAKAQRRLRDMSPDATTVKRVLIVEDDDVFRVSLRATLAAQGYAVLAVDTAEAAETVLEREAVDVVLSDLRLPGMTG